MFPFRFQWYPEALPPKKSSSFCFDLQHFLSSCNKSQATRVHFPFCFGGVAHLKRKIPRWIAAIYEADGIFTDHFAQWALWDGEGGDESKGGRGDKAGAEEDVVTQDRSHQAFFFFRFFGEVVWMPWSVSWNHNWSNMEEFLGIYTFSMFLVSFWIC